jgi:hypothetical protein
MAERSALENLDFITFQLVCPAIKSGFNPKRCVPLVFGDFHIVSAPMSVDCAGTFLFIPPPGIPNYKNFRTLFSLV